MGLISAPTAAVVISLVAGGVAVGAIYAFGIRDDGAPAAEVPVQTADTGSPADDRARAKAMGSYIAQKLKTESGASPLTVGRLREASKDLWYLEIGTDATPRSFCFYVDLELMRGGQSSGQFEEEGMFRVRCEDSTP